MYANRIWIFNVEHGAAIFVRSSSGATMMLDCGKGTLFSPARYIRTNELTEQERGWWYPLHRLVVSHPHDDHIEDIANIQAYLRPWTINHQLYNWGHVKGESGGDYANLDQWADMQATYNGPPTNSFWGSVNFSLWSLTVAEAWELNPSKYINNSSIVTILSIGSFKLVYPGDLESDGWDALLGNAGFRNELTGASVFVTSHHGHDSGFNPRIYDAMGLPWFNLSSIHHGDVHICGEYSRAERARGWTYNGEFRRSFTTRTDGSCLIEVDNVGNWRFDFHDLGMNLLPPLSQLSR